MNKKYKNKRKIINRNRGITLIALVVTIIVLLIISAVAINLTIGSNGIFKRAEDATNIYDEKTIDENLRMLYQEQLIDEAAGRISRDETDVFLEMTKGKEVSQEDIERFNKALGKYSKKLFGIWTIEDLKSIGNSEEYPLDGIYIQFEDITIGEEGISPIGTVEKPFTGIYNGNGKKIEELNIKAEVDNIGLFGVNSGKIENVTVEGYNLEVNYAQTGTIAGENSGIITKCINNNGEIHSNGNNDGSRVGGIVGLNKEDGLVEGCTNNSNISGEYKLVGGIVGYNLGAKIENCNNYGNISGPSQVGGIAGNTGGVDESSTAYLGNCNNYGNVEGKNIEQYNNDGSIGEIAGLNYHYSIIEKSKNEGIVKCDSWYAGGIIGINYDTVNNCINKGEVQSISGASTSQQIGGIVGRNACIIKECLNTGDVSGTTDNFDYIGGIAGVMNGTSYVRTLEAKIEKCYNSGNITGNNNIGGLVGRTSELGEINSCYNIGDVTGNSLVGGITGATVGGANYIYNSYNKGKISSITEYAGGITGIIRCKIENCYNSGKVEMQSTSDRVGGLFGTLDISYVEKEKIKNCYYLDSSYSKACGNESVIGNIEGAKSITDEELKNLAETLGSEFKKNEEGDMYPKLIWE